MQRSDTSDLLRLSRRPIGFLLRHLRPYAGSHVTIMITVLGAVACSVGANYAVKNLIDTLAGGPSNVSGTAVWTAFAILAGIITADNMLWRIGGWIAADRFPRATASMRAELFHHLSGHSPGYFANRSAGTLAARISATGTAGFTVLQNFTWHTVPPAVAVMLAIAFLGSVDPIMAGCLVIAAAALAIGVAWLGRKGEEKHDRFAGRAATVDGQLVDVVQNFSLVRAFGAFGRERMLLDKALADETAARRASLRYLEKLRLVHGAATAVLTAVLLWWVVTLWQAGRATAGDIVLVCTLGFTILHASRDLAMALVDLTQYVARMREALVSLLVPHDLPDVENAHRLLGKGGAVDFRDVTFSYPQAPAGAPPILRGLNLSIPKGQKVGVVGRSGAGKSTLLTLLQRHSAPQAGEVNIDGQNIAEATRESLAEQIAVVPQDVSLFHRTVLENIRYARPDASDEEVLRAAEAARCREFIEALPEGFNTVVGDRGAKLSGGQRQRLAIARALLKDAPILLLDEATSALDSESEAEVQTALDSLMEGRTVIAVAHRLATLTNFDRIVVMDQGQVVQDGPPDQLMRRAGPYQDMVRRQSEALQVAA
ncbi:ABC transporter ATP-binding protein [Teichococcus vastitatis]|uniref:ABC transporter ATP-binding protein/permease n=1 Tax=Teichococcus vastitatis TaxID=2307076 RepID=A0ABS9W5N0_9PROT|nr:ABC transporter ATP-binding protein [Pseudoroseomonas vastitatis]MCI0754589.1 ABC transporter ATP-binding protein/permease [Pseudoroseomonas vastitatis]